MSGRLDSNQRPPEPHSGERLAKKAEKPSDFTTNHFPHLTRIPTVLQGFHGFCYKSATTVVYPVRLLDHEPTIIPLALRGVRQVVPVATTSKPPLMPRFRLLRVPDALSGSMATPGAA